jgi:hypothetical protein
MPRVSAFYGIAVYLYYRDHPPPHVHAIYGEHEAAVEIATGAIIAGSLPRRARIMVEDWLATNRAAVQQNWDLAAAGQPLTPVPPLV